VKGGCSPQNNLLKVAPVVSEVVHSRNQNFSAIMGKGGPIAIKCLMLGELQLQNFRCFEALATNFCSGFNFIIGANGEGKTSILEAACVLLRLQSQRSSSLAPLVKFGAKWFGLAGDTSGHRLEFRYSALRRKIAFDHVEQRTAAEYLQLARVVSFANTDIELVRGSSESRRRYLDFIGSQLEPIYRPTLRAYERALRCRNALLKSAQPRAGEIAAYDQPLIEHGAALGKLRAQIAARIAPLAASAHQNISGTGEALLVGWSAGNSDDFAADLANSRAAETRLRQTIVGPHRDDLELLIDGKAATQFASEGQQRTIALALKIAQAEVFRGEETAPPLLLIDDVFGELDPTRRNALLRALPSDSQNLVTATSMSWREVSLEGQVFHLENRRLTQG
jgi:DNA replication and repair protein RecF